MYSLLTEELKKYTENNTLPKINTLPKNNANNSKIIIKVDSNDNDNKFININYNIDKSQVNDDPIDECRLNINIFNPGKNSPPNEWQFRLLKRINSINNISD